ncbi:hypothetical protein FQA39_LY09214 [Lamprigera yunnana]|nr:hypothetical protein FQA39_LY09214 [Lamprigera yunnana]
MAGWTLEGDKYEFHWFDGDQLPDCVSQSLKEELVENPQDNAEQLDIQYQDWLDDELPYFNDDDNENYKPIKYLQIKLTIIILKKYLSDLLQFFKIQYQ